MHNTEIMLHNGERWEYHQIASGSGVLITAVNAMATIQMIDDKYTPLVSLDIEFDTAS